MDLIGLQQSAKRIRNPFCDLVVTWDSKPFLFKKDPDKWISLVGALARHAAKRLYQKVYYQYHDEQKAKLLAEGRDKEARKYRVPRQTEDLIWFMITGEHLYRDIDTTAEQQEAADLAALHSEITKLDAKATASSELFNVSGLLEAAQQEAYETVGSLGDGESAHVSGRGKVIDKAEAPKVTDKVSELIADEAPAQVEVEASEAEVTEVVVSDPSQEGDFADLQTLE